MRFDQIQIGHHGVLVISGVEIRVCGIDDSDQSVMDECGAWHSYTDVDFPEYHY